MELAIECKPLQHVSVCIISIEVWVMKKVFYQFLIISIEVWVMKKVFYQFLHIFVKTGAGRRHIVTI